MDRSAEIALILLIISEILPFTPLKGNGIVQQLVKTLRVIYPYRPRR